MLGTGARAVLLCMCVYLFRGGTELELELTQTYMTQKSLLWGEVGALAVSKKSEFAGVVWAGASVGAEWLLPFLAEPIED